MKVSKFEQSHLVITNGTSKIVIDPGMLTFKQGRTPEEFAGADAYLFTHSHGDHLDPDTVKAVVGDKMAFGNADVCATLKQHGITATEIHDGETFQAGGYEVKAVDLAHCLMQDGSSGPPNTGFVINGILFHPGDGDRAPAGLMSNNVALPIAGPTINLEGALQFAKDLQAKVVIPIHNDFFHSDPEEFTRMAKEAEIEVRNLKPGEETEI